MGAARRAVAPRSAAPRPRLVDAVLEITRHGQCGVRAQRSVGHGEEQRGARGGLVLRGVHGRSRCARRFLLPYRTVIRPFMICNSPQNAHKRYPHACPTAWLARGRLASDFSHIMFRCTGPQLQEDCCHFFEPNGYVQDGREHMQKIIAILCLLIGVHFLLVRHGATPR